MPTLIDDKVEKETEGFNGDGLIIRSFLALRGDIDHVWGAWSLFVRGDAHLILPSMHAGNGVIYDSLRRRRQCIRCYVSFKRLDPHGGIAKQSIPFVGYSTFGVSLRV